ncbi:protein NETWORKED 2D-like [Vigna unguiculata]|uniref:protein NETWORKED 2D-like n=1 Tax=Vigna unguiculata TaxID=3917 RepID=UPI001015CD48|nr:protein NETWORKED 2D-like [Vigna unguiculata]
MLQRAASNAYSWWWVSHIRTKQSKWMEQNLQDMEEKVQSVMKLLAEEGDSFAKRAEMYYKRRPELISFVEESFKAYRALAERYDHISTELQNANNTIASVFPDRVPFMDEDDDDQRPPKKNPEKLKNIPKPPHKDLKTVITTAAAASKKLQSKKSAATAAAATPKVPKSGLSRKEARGEIDKLQKEILALQTVKEFAKNSYENSRSRYRDTDEQIKELQERVSSLQEELGEGVDIEDDEARRLIAGAALQSCQEALTKLEKKQERSLDETKIESKRVKDVKAKVGSLMDEFHYERNNSKEPGIQSDLKIIAETELDENADDLSRKKKELQLLKENLKENFETSSNSSFSVAEMAEKIDELVNKVISLETAVSSQSAMVKRLRTETDELQEQIRILEKDKENLINDRNTLNDQLRKMEKKMHGVEDLNQIVEDQNSNLQTQLTEAHSNLDHLSEKVQNVQPGEESNTTHLSDEQKDSSTQEEIKCESTAGLVEDDDATDKGLKVAGTVEDDLTSDNKPEVTGSPFANGTGSLENDVKSVNEVEVTSSLKMEETTPVENKFTEDLKEEEKNVNPGKGDEKATTDVSTTTENQEVGQQLASNKLDSCSESSEKQQENDAKQSSCEIENPLKVDSKEQATAQDEPDWQKLLTDCLQMEETTPVENNFPEELKEQEKNVNPGKRDEKATTDVSTTTESQEVEQQLESNKLDSCSESSEKQQENDAKQSPCEIEKSLKVDSNEQATAQDEPDWRKLFTNGMHDREQVLLAEYTNTLRNYKDVKKRLAEIETKNQDSNFNSSVQLKELKTANATKDEQIKILRQKLVLLQRSFEGNEYCAEVTVVMPSEKNGIEELLKIEPESTSPIEDKFRSNVDEILEENLTFWLKFSAYYSEIQKFQTTVKDLQTELSKLQERGKTSEGSSSIKYSIRSDAKPIYKHLTEIQGEITVWMEKGAVLKEELHSRFTSLCDIQEEITAALKSSAEDDDFRFTSYQAAKFQGEILNMKQENNKVADELQAGLDVVSALQLDIEKALVNLNDEHGFSVSKRQQNGQLRQSETRAKVPLRSFIFGSKPKKQSIFSCMAPGTNRKYR